MVLGARLNHQEKNGKKENQPFGLVPK